ncbi:MAG: toll/interleukin-1 receptor domain-containing protein [Armatimonadetes bacterium]|nr:toll/interleukin-1 receptor domain-containing protein [Armatimonadota bacterium]
MHPYRVFVSYSRDDLELARRLVDILGRAGLTPIWDQDIELGSAFSEAIRNTISHADVFMPLLTEQYVTRPWLRQEIGHAMDLGIPVLPIAVGDVQLPWLLIDRQALHVRADLSGLQGDTIREAVSAVAGRKHLIFISAKSEDYEDATQVYQFLIDHGLTVFFSRESLPRMGNADYGDQIDEALEEAAHMVVVTSSRERVTSEWVKAEWRLFVNEKRSGRKTGNLLTVITSQMNIGDLPATLRGSEVVELTTDGLDRLLAFVKDPPKSS